MASLPEMGPICPVVFPFLGYFLPISVLSASVVQAQSISTGKEKSLQSRYLCSHREVQLYHAAHLGPEGTASWVFTVQARSFITIYQDGELMSNTGGNKKRAPATSLIFIFLNKRKPENRKKKSSSSRTSTSEHMQTYIWRTVSVLLSTNRSNNKVEERIKKGYKHDQKLPLFRTQMIPLCFFYTKLERTQMSKCLLKVAPPYGSPARLLERRVGLQNHAPRWCCGDFCLLV